MNRIEHRPSREARRLRSGGIVADPPALRPQIDQCRMVDETITGVDMPSAPPMVVTIPAAARPAGSQFKQALKGGGRPVSKAKREVPSQSQVSPGGAPDPREECPGHSRPAQECETGCYGEGSGVRRSLIYFTARSFGIARDAGDRVSVRAFQGRRRKRLVRPLRPPASSSSVLGAGEVDGSGHVVIEARGEALVRVLVRDRSPRARSAGPSVRFGGAEARRASS